MKKVLTVVGTRPNIIKITQFNRVVAKFPNLEHRMIHTGQHYSKTMNDVFFDELKLSLPDYSLDVDKSSVIRQMAGIMNGLEDVVKEYQPDLINVVGDVNSTFAAALVANKHGIKLAHIESGLRSLDNTMPEEHNRILTDSISDIYFVTEKSGWNNLEQEGKNMDNVYFVGNTMIDTLVHYDQDIRASKVVKDLGLESKRYALMTMHRPGNVDHKKGLVNMVDVVTGIAEHLDVVFPIHPRTVKMLESHGLYAELTKNDRIHLSEPMGYLDFQSLILNSVAVVTDSGGIQEETTYRKIPCITLRPNTERPSTLEIGSNVLMELEKDKIVERIQLIESNELPASAIPEKWDGKATERIFEVINDILQPSSSVVGL